MRHIPFIFFFVGNVSKTVMEWPEEETGGVFISICKQLFLSIVKINIMLERFFSRKRIRNRKTYYVLFYIIVT